MTTLSNTRNAVKSLACESFVKPSPGRMPWVKRYRSVAGLVKADVERTYDLLRSMCHPQTRLCFPAYSQIAKERGITRRTAIRHVAAIGKVGLLQKECRPAGYRSHRSNAFRLPDPTPDFLATLLSLPSDTKVTVKLLPERKNKQPLLPPTPLPGGGACVAPSHPVPSAEVHQALQQARAFRAQRKAERRQRRYSAAREARRSRGEATPVQRAVRHAMAALGVSPGLWSTRLALQTSVERWMREYGVGPEAAVNGLVGRWKDYHHGVRWRLEYPCGMLTWFGECRWLGSLPKQVERELQREAQARIGMPDEPAPTVRIDLAALQAKITTLLESWDGDEGEDEGCEADAPGVGFFQDGKRGLQVQEFWGARDVQVSARIGGRQDVGRDGEEPGGECEDDTAAFGECRSGWGGESRGERVDNLENSNAVTFFRVDCGRST